MARFTTRRSDWARVGTNRLPLGGGPVPRRNSAVVSSRRYLPSSERDESQRSSSGQFVKTSQRITDLWSAVWPDRNIIITPSGNTLTLGQQRRRRRGWRVVAQIGTRLFTWTATFGIVNTTTPRNCPLDVNGNIHCRELSWPRRPARS